MCYTRVKHHLNASIVERIHHTGKYCDERFLCYNGDVSVNFPSIFSELNCFAYAQIHVRVAYLFFLDIVTTFNVLFRIMSTQTPRSYVTRMRKVSEKAQEK